MVFLSINKLCYYLWNPHELFKDIFFQACMLFVSLFFTSEAWQHRDVLQESSVIWKIVQWWKGGKKTRKSYTCVQIDFSTDLPVPESGVQPYSTYRMKSKYCWHFENPCFTGLSRCTSLNYEKYKMKCLVKRNTWLQAWCHRQNFGLFNHGPFYMTPGVL